METPLCDTPPTAWPYWAGRVVTLLPHARKQAMQRGLPVLTVLPMTGRVVKSDEDRYAEGHLVYRLELRHERQKLCYVATDYGLVITAFAPWDDRLTGGNIRNPHDAARQRRQVQCSLRKSQKGHAI